NALVVSCASRLAIVAYDAALKMQKPSAATRGHEMSGRMPQKSRSRLPSVITAEPSQAIASRTVPPNLPFCEKDDLSRRFRSGQLEPSWNQASPSTHDPPASNPTEQASPPPRTRGPRRST